MAYRIQATTATDLDLLLALRDLAWKRRLDVSEVIRQAFQGILDGPELAEGNRKAVRTHLELVEDAAIVRNEAAYSLAPDGWLYSPDRKQWRDPEGIWHDQLPA